MKTLSIDTGPQKWAEVLGWIAAGDEVQLTRDDKPVARLSPEGKKPESQPDFLARAKAIWGNEPPGRASSELVSEGR